jgi:hypothetical protein
MKTRKNKIDPVTGSIRQPWPLIFLGAVFIFGGLSFALMSFPYLSSSYIWASFVFGLVGVMLMLWINYFPNLWVKWVLFMDLITLCTLFAIRCYVYLFPEMELLWVMIIVATVVFSYIIPLVNHSLTRFLRVELTSPQTSAGKKIYVIGLFLGPLAGLIGTLGGMLIVRESNNTLLAVLAGSFLWLIAIFLPFSSRYPISPFERKE